MNEAIRVSLAAAVVAGGLLVAQPHETHTVTQERISAVLVGRVCYEDEPCWDCRTMGNLICGPGAKLPDGRPAMPGYYGNTYTIV